MADDKYGVLVIGAGQAGLATSYYLDRAGFDYIVLEQGELVERWRNQRWDSFSLVTPNYSTKLPGYEYSGDDLDGYLTRDELLAWFEGYAASFNPHIEFNREVLSVVPNGQSDGFRVTTGDRVFATGNVIVATGILQLPRIPDASRDLPPSITQYHTSEYRNPTALPSGAVLVVGTGQSGCQIAEELYKSGRNTYLCVGSNGRIPRRYRGKDAYAWIEPAGINTSTVGKFSNHAHVTGRDGGYELNLHQFARDGVVLLGRLVRAKGSRITLAPDLMQNLARADRFYEQYRQEVDAYIDREQIDAPIDVPQPVLNDGYRSPVIEEFDLREAGINTVVWATGYRYDFSWIDAPVFDERGFPIQARGVTEYPGLYFVGMNWEQRPKSAFIGSVGSEADHVVQHIVQRHES